MGNGGIRYSSKLPPHGESGVCTYAPVFTNTLQDGFGVHTYRLVTDDGKSKFVKWHFKTKQGKASLVWDEAQHMAGKNADYHRQDLWNAIESGNFPEWELNVQIFDEEQAQAFGFDVLDPTKIIPEELVPLTPLGVLKLDVNPINYFAEVEQAMVSAKGPRRSPHHS